MHYHKQIWYYTRDGIDVMTRREQEMLTLWEQKSTPPVLMGFVLLDL